METGRKLLTGDEKRLIALRSWVKIWKIQNAER